MKVIGVIPARYASTRFPGKPLADICGKPMIWWVYQQAKKSQYIQEVYVATENEEIFELCNAMRINVLMTNSTHDTPTSRIYEVSQKIDADYYLFVGGDEPLIATEHIDQVLGSLHENPHYIVHAMTTIRNASEVIDFTNTKVVTNQRNECIYASRSPLPYPKGSLEFTYKKLVGIVAFSKASLEFFNQVGKSDLERIEECDFTRFLEYRKTIKMVDVDSASISVDTEKDLWHVREIMRTRLE